MLLAVHASVNTMDRHFDGKFGNQVQAFIWKLKHGEKISSKKKVSSRTSATITRHLRRLDSKTFGRFSLIIRLFIAVVSGRVYYVGMEIGSMWVRL